MDAPDQPLDPDQLDELGDLAEEAGRAAAELLADGLRRDRRRIDTKSSSTDLVTEMDRASEELVVSRLLEARPHDAVLGEEGTDRPGTSGVRWIIDPLDGTTNYVYRHPGVSVSIAAEVGGALAVGVVVDVMAGDCFRAARGRGATRDGRDIEASSPVDLGQALVATGFGYDAGQRQHQGQVLAQVLGEIRDIRRMGSAALDLCSVACGRVDAFYELRLRPWDFAAGAVIATEAGAAVLDLDGRWPSTNVAASSVLAANPPLLDALRGRLLEAGANA